MKYDDLEVGTRFGMLEITGPYETHDSHACYPVKCDCGEERITRASDLVREISTSCGCVRITHGCSEENPRLYKIWLDMIRRCTKTTLEEYAQYGGRGITVCDEWLESPRPFFDWAYANGYDKRLTIDRIDNDQGYYPENCRFNTAQGQAQNRSTNKFSVEKVLQAKKMFQAGETVKTISRKMNINKKTVKDVLTERTWKNVKLDVAVSANSSDTADTIAA